MFTREKMKVHKREDDDERRRKFKRSKKMKVKKTKPFFNVKKIIT